MNERPKLPIRTKPQTIEMARGDYDLDVWHAMQERDDRLIEDEILNGAGSRKFVYSFRNGQGVSAMGARELAYQYGKLKYRIVSSMQKKGAMLIYESYAGDRGHPQVSVDVVAELEQEPDFYKVVGELTDLHTGNTYPTEAIEMRMGMGKNGPYEREHYQKIAQSKAYRDAVLHALPQHLVIAFLIKNLAIPENAQDITQSVIEQKRKALLAYTAKEGIAINRDAVNDLTMDQIAGLSDAAREKDPVKLVQALNGLGLIESKESNVEARQSQRAERQEEHQAQESGRAPAPDAEGPREGKGKAEAGAKQRPALFRNEE